MLIFFFFLFSKPRSKTTKQDENLPLLLEGENELSCQDENLSIIGKTFPGTFQGISCTNSELSVVISNCTFNNLKVSSLISILHSHFLMEFTRFEGCILSLTGDQEIIKSQFRNSNFLSESGNFLFFGENHHQLNISHCDFVNCYSNLAPTTSSGETNETTFENTVIFHSSDFLNIEYSKFEYTNEIINTIDTIQTDNELKTLQTEDEKYFLRFIHSIRSTNQISETKETQAKQLILFKNCEFQGNQGISIFLLEGDSSLEIETCTFINFTTTIIDFLSKEGNLTIINSNFEGSTSIIEQSIINTKRKNNNSSNTNTNNNEDNNIENDSENINVDFIKIEGCSFIDCKSNQNLIFINSNHFIMSDTTIFFTMKQNLYPILYGEKEGTIYSITDSKFENCFKSIEFVGNTGELSINFCIFEECGTSDYIIKVFPKDRFCFENCIVHFNDHKSANQVLVIPDNEFEFDIHFQNNSFIKCGRGSYPVSKVFDINCVNSNITLIDCFLTKCGTKNSGYMISLKSNTLTISNVSIVGINKDDNLKGFLLDCNMIFIDHLNMSYCSGKNPENQGCAIACSSPKEMIEISDSCFIDCGWSEFSVLHLKHSIVKVTNVSILFSTDNQKCNGIYIDCLCKLIIDTFIINGSSPRASGKRGAINYTPSQSSFTKENFEEIQISNTKISHASGNNAVIEFTPYDAQIIFDNVTIEDCNQNTGDYVISIIQNYHPVTTPLIFNNCTFKNLQHKHAYCGGTGIWFSCEINKTIYGLTLEFNNCSIVKCSHSQNGGALEFGTSVTLRKHSLFLDNCTITDNLSNQNGGAIYFNTSGSLSVSNCIFENNKCPGNGFSGGTIYATMGSFFTCINNRFIASQASKCGVIYFKSETDQALQFEIKDCYFEKCVSNAEPFCYCCGNNSHLQSIAFSNLTFIDCISQNSHPLIYPQFKTVSFNNCQFKCSSNEKTTKAFQVDGDTHLIVSECIFMKCNSRNDGGAFSYEQSSTSDESITLKDCYFYSCFSPNSQAFKLKPFIIIPSLSNLTFEKNHGNYIFAIIYDANIIFDSVDINSCKFIGNKNTANDGGGSGIWISNLKKDDNTYYTYVSFSDCNFSNNTGVNGGAFGVGFSHSVAPTSAIFSHCSFIGNYGQKNGGAIYFRTTLSSTINNCTFLNNSASGSGGAIYSNCRVVSNITIINCNFTNCYMNNPELGSAIFFTAMSPCVLKNCNFHNCGKYGSVINAVSDSSIYDTTFVFDSIEESTHGIVFSYAPSIDIRRCKFIRCKADESKSFGGAIYYPGYQYQTTNLIVISENIFEECKASDKGSCCYLKININPSINGNKFYRHHNAIDIFAIDIDLDIDTSVYFVPLTFNNMTFEDNNIDGHCMFQILIKGQVITNADYTFNNCQFIMNTNCFISQFRNPNFKFEKCQFINNNNKEYGILYVDTTQNVLFNQCYFDSNNAIEGGGTLIIENALKVEITNCCFDNENCEFSPKGYIISSNSNLFLSNVTLNNCCTFNYSIISNSNKFTFINSNLKASGGILIPHVSDVILINSTIKESEFGIIYQPLEYDADINYHKNDVLQLENCIFDFISGTACELYIFNNIEMKNNTFSNCLPSNPNGKTKMNISKTRNYDNKGEEHEKSSLPIFLINIMNISTTSITFEDFNFSNNHYFSTHSDVTGGGIGLIVNFLADNETSKSISEHQYELEGIIDSNEISEILSQHQEICSKNQQIFRLNEEALRIRKSEEIKLESIYDNLFPFNTGNKNIQENLPFIFNLKKIPKKNNSNEKEEESDNDISKTYSSIDFSESFSAQSEFYDSFFESISFTTDSLTASESPVQTPSESSNATESAQPETPLATPSSLPTPLPVPDCRKFDFLNCYFYKNKANINGGAYSIQRNDTIVSFINCIFIQNECEEGNGGAIWIHTMFEVFLKSCLFDSNISPNHGSAAFIEQRHLFMIHDCTFNNNSGKSTLYIQTLELTEEDYQYHLSFNCNITDCIFTNNYNGSSLYLISQFKTVLYNCQFGNNSIENHLIENNSCLKMEITEECIISECEFSKNAGNIISINIDHQLIMNDCEFHSNNFHSNLQNMIFIHMTNESSLLSIENCTFTNNIIENIIDNSNNLNNIEDNNSEEGNILKIIGKSDLKMYKCNFHNCISHSKKNIFYIEIPEIVTFFNCNFLNDEEYQNKLRYSIKCQTKTIIFDEGKFSNSGGLLLPYSMSKIVFTNLEFLSCSNGIIYSPKFQQKECDITIEKCLFKKISESAISLFITKDLILHNISLIECRRFISTQIDPSFSISSSEEFHEEIITTNLLFKEENEKNEEEKFNAILFEEQNIEYFEEIPIKSFLEFNVQERKKIKISFTNSIFTNNYYISSIFDQENSQEESIHRGSGIGLIINYETISNNTEELQEKIIPSTLPEKEEEEETQKQIQSLFSSFFVNKVEDKTHKYRKIKDIGKNGEIEFRECSFISNTAASGGGGCLSFNLNEVSFSFNKCQFSFNQCLKGHGGAIEINSTEEIIINECLFRENEADLNGGGLYIQTKSYLTIHECNFFNNSAKNEYCSFSIISEGQFQLTKCNITKIYSANKQILINNEGSQTFHIFNNMFTHIQPSTPQIYLFGIQNSEFQFSNNQFNYFYNIKQIQRHIVYQLEGKLTFTEDCFDTNEPINDDMNNSTHKNSKCQYPEELEEILEEILPEATPSQTFDSNMYNTDSSMYNPDSSMYNPDSDYDSEMIHTSDDKTSTFSDITPEEEQKKKTISLAVGVSIAFAIVIIILFVVIIIISRRKKEISSDHEKDMCSFEIEISSTFENETNNTILSKYTKSWNSMQSTAATQENPLFTDTFMDPHSNSDCFEESIYGNGLV
ncbi:hypothetical protein TRFO_18392 [Tritrichomonas foetus]|uniref:Right handed beta helix domain-containing protein n=1 Tax=Tritrichomonas foetus TaxID=1144522 RepID=A0A1J4KKV8_9EUKA|nr:hypothetical protein TRFO_18392 [Tritrichomonas foetus]|eukprot:OHT11927.1 hypothetical protein TRFO_18392 [Tritrichomonas foetus]